MDAAVAREDAPAKLRSGWSAVPARAAYPTKRMTDNSHSCILFTIFKILDVSTCKVSTHSACISIA